MLSEYDHYPLISSKLEVSEVRRSTIVGLFKISITLPHHFRKNTFIARPIECNYPTNCLIKGFLIAKK